MSDLISRQMAIDTIDSIGCLDTNAEREYARELFKNLPSAQKKGEWKRKAEWLWQGYECSNCKYAVDLRTNFCPICGADMRSDIHRGICS